MDITHDRRLGQQVQGGVDTDVAFDLAIDFHLLAQQIADDHGFTAHDQMLADRELTFDIGVIQLKIFTGDVAFDFACDTDQTFTFDIANDDALNIQIALAGKVTFDHRSYGDDGFSAGILAGTDRQIRQGSGSSRDGSFFHQIRLF